MQPKKLLLIEFRIQIHETGLLTINTLTMSHIKRGCPVLIKQDVQDLTSSRKYRDKNINLLAHSSIKQSQLLTP